MVLFTLNGLSDLPVGFFGSSLSTSMAVALDGRGVVFSDGLSLADSSNLSDVGGDEDLCLFIAVSVS